MDLVLFFYAMVFLEIVFGFIYLSMPILYAFILILILIDCWFVISLLIVFYLHHTYVIPHEGWYIYCVQYQCYMLGLAYEKREWVNLQCDIGLVITYGLGFLLH